MEQLTNMESSTYTNTHNSNCLNCFGDARGEWNADPEGGFGFYTPCTRFETLGPEARAEEDFDRWMEAREPDREN